VSPVAARLVALLTAATTLACEATHARSGSEVKMPVAARAEAPKGGPMATESLAGKLVSLGYMGLFLTLDDAELDRLWRQGSGGAALAALVIDPSADGEARFLAAEAMFRKQPGYPSATDIPGLRPVYVEGLRRSQLANIWGMPGEADGPAGQHLLALGEPTAAQLIPLLKDGRRILYAGSEEATVGDAYEYRIKDLAAFFIARLRNLPYAVRKTPAERDAEIARLHAAL
jgi:hypothetical protein